MASVRLVLSRRKVLVFILICFLSVSLLWTLIANATAISDSSWLTNANPKLIDEELTIPRISYGNRECIDKAALTCVTRTALGTLGGSLKLNGTSSAYPVISFFGDSRILPVPNSDTVITYFPGSNGYFLFFTKGFSSSLKLNLVNGSLRYESIKAPDARLRDKSGNLLLAADFDPITFSKNGQWMLVHSGGAGMLRVNLETYDILPFGPTYRFDPGLNPFLQSTISNDGRYAVIASSISPMFRVYDLATCSKVPDEITVPVNCEFKDLGPLLVTKFQGTLVGTMYIRFLDEDSLSFYAIHNTGTGNEISRYKLHARDNSSLDFLALGDSYISGEGVFNYRDGTDIGSNRCHLSNSSYPYLIGDLFRWSSYESVACSGSTIEDIIPIDEQAYNDNERQGKGKSEDIFNPEIYDNFLPGYRGQINFVKRNTPDIVTISVGGNNIGFDDILKRCLSPDTCYEFYEDRLELVRQINSNFELLVETYEQIKQNTSSTARVYVIGYPQVAKSNGKCSANVHLNSRELEFAEHLISYLNLVIKNAATKAGVYYIDIENALKPYRLCENEENFMAVHGLTAGNDAPVASVGPVGKESYHPNAFGHELIRNQVIHSTSRFTIQMPVPDPAASPPSESNLQILNTAKSNRQTYSSFYDSSITNETQERGGLWHTALDGIKYSLKPLSPISAVLNSTPVQLGTYMTTSNGDLDIQIQAPADLPTGYHTLHLYGTNIAGEPIDVYRVIYVAASFDDLDGDGISNSSEKCLVVEPANEDFDEDGKDDACDSIISDKSSPVTSLDPLNNAVLGFNFGVTTSLLQRTQNYNINSSNFIADADNPMPTGQNQVLSETTNQTTGQNNSNRSEQGFVYLAGLAVVLAGTAGLRLVRKNG